MPNVLNLCLEATGQVQYMPFFGQVVAPAPASFASPLNVLLPDIDNTTPWSLGRWPQSHGTTLPTVGTTCLVAFDNRRNPWVVAW